ncbi:hypothetical protein D3C87_1509530 [compost metagenome]
MTIGKLIASEKVNSPDSLEVIICFELLTVNVTPETISPTSSYVLPKICVLFCACTAIGESAPTAIAIAKDFILYFIGI